MAKVRWFRERDRRFARRNLRDLNGVTIIFSDAMRARQGTKMSPGLEAQPGPGRRRKPEDSEKEKNDAGKKENVIRIESGRLARAACGGPHHFLKTWLGFSQLPFHHNYRR